MTKHSKAKLFFHAFGTCCLASLVLVGCRVFIGIILYGGFYGYEHNILIAYTELVFAIFGAFYCTFLVIDNFKRGFKKWW